MDTTQAPDVYRLGAHWTTRSSIEGHTKREFQ